MFLLDQKHLEFIARYFPRFIFSFINILSLEFAKHAPLWRSLFTDSWDWSRCECECVCCVCRACIKYIVLCNQILSLKTIPTFFDCVQFPVFHIDLNGIGKTLDYSRNWCFVGVMLFSVDVPVTACHHWIYIHNCYGAYTWHFDKQTPTECVCVCVISRISGLTDMNSIKLDINKADRTFLRK